MFLSSESQKQRRESWDYKTIQRNNGENFPNLVKDINLKTKEGE